MGHRALVAYERDTGRYDVHYAHWGGQWQLPERIGPTRPFGAHPSSGTGDAPVVDPDPLATDCAFEAILDTHLDFQQHEACYEVGREWTVRPSLVCWFGLPSVDRCRPGDGALLGVDPTDVRADGEHLRGWFAGTKETVCTMVDRGCLSPAAARAALATAVASWADERRVRFGPEVAGGES